MKTWFALLLSVVTAVALPLAAHSEGSPYRDGPRRNLMLRCEQRRTVCEQRPAGLARQARARLFAFEFLTTPRRNLVP